MKNKDFIIKFKDNAELAMASYGYFDRLQWNIEANNNIQIKKRMEKFRTQYAKLHNLDIKKDKDIIQNTEVTLLDILNVEYNNVLGGDFSPTQAKRFFEKYDMLIHQPNTHSGFSATLFQNKESKEYTLAIRGTESHHNFKYNRVAS